MAGSLEAIQPDEKDYHDLMLTGLQKRQAEIRERLDLIYLNRLDRNISEETYLRLRDRRRFAFSLAPLR